MKETRRNTIMLISDEIKDRGIFPSPSFDDVFRKINAVRTYLVPRKNKMEQSKTSGTGRSVNYRRRWQFYESLFLADFITPPNTESNLERCQQTNSEKKTQIKADKQKQTVGVTELNRTVKLTYYSSQVWRCIRMH